jgi:hypothetical protein
MKTQDFTTTLLVDETPATVFSAINQPQNWWTGEIKGNSAKLNDEFTYRYREFHFSRQRVIEMINNKKVVWLVTQSQINHVKEINEWTGTQIRFEITAKGGKTKLRFSNIGLVPEIECFNGCSGAWAQLINVGLLSLIKTGLGYKIDLE